MSSSVGAGIVRYVRRCPVTSGLIALACVLATAEAVYRAAVDDPLGSRHALGGVELLKYEAEPELFGPLALWAGDWWRIPVSAFHHGGSGSRPFDPLQWLHLGMNAVTLAFLGGLLEPRLRGSVYLLLVLGAALVSVLPEFLLQNLVFGLSGVACAQFGMLLVVRSRDPEVARALSREIVCLVLVWLLACIPLRLWEILPVANVAHLAGLAYGWLAGQVIFGPAAGFAGRAAFIAAHLALVPGLAAATQPVWVGRYHWYLASLEIDPDRRAVRWQDALDRDPALEKLWLQLADYHRRQGRTLDAWRTILAGVDANRTFEDGVRSARRLWGRLRRDRVLREQARQILSERFGPEAPAWRDRLGIPPEGVERLAELGPPRGPLEPPPDSALDVSRYSLERRIELHADDDPPAPQDLNAPPVDPDAAGSAALGNRL